MQITTKWIKELQIKKDICNIEYYHLKYEKYCYKNNTSKGKWESFWIGNSQNRKPGWLINIWKDASLMKEIPERIKKFWRI